MIEIKVVRNDILNNIYIHDQTYRMHRSPPRVAKNFQIKKIKGIDKSDANISDSTIECFDREKSSQKLYIEQLISP